MICKGSVRDVIVIIRIPTVACWDSEKPWKHLSAYPMPRPRFESNTKIKIQRKSFLLYSENTHSNFYRDTNRPGGDYLWPFPLLTDKWTGYGQDGRGSILGKRKTFLFFVASRPAQGPTQPPIQWVPNSRNSSTELGNGLFH
jgi:hypothetical protein